MPDASPSRLRLDWITPSPHRASFQSFVNVDDPVRSGLHALLQRVFPWQFTHGAGREIKIDYLGYRIVSSPYNEQPAAEFLAHKRTYYRLVKLLLRISEDGKTQDKEYLLTRLPWLTRGDTFIIGGLEIIPIAQLLPATGMLFTTRTRPGDFSHQEFVADLRPLYGPSLRLRCWRPPGSKKPHLRGAIHIGSLQPWDLEKFHALLNKETSSELLHWPDSLKHPPTDTESTQTDAEAAPQLMDLLQRIYLGRVGRTRLQHKLAPAFRYLQLPADSHQMTFTKEDLTAAVWFLAALAAQEPFTAELDDSEHLANQRARLVGDFLEEALWRGLWETKTAVKEQLKSSNSAKQPEQSISEALQFLSSIVDEHVQDCFRLGPLFQLLDTTNPLAAVSHKRTVTRGGPGGINSRYPNLEKRDIHSSHYGRLCPCETPESEDIGLTLHLALYAGVSPDGQLTTPAVSTATQEICHLPPEAIDTNAFCTEEEFRPERRRAERVLTRRYEITNDRAGDSRSEIAYLPAEEVTYQDALPEQQLGLAAALIPFLSHSDANRMLMGAKNLKQALPLLHPEVPLVQTGMETVIAALSRDLPASLQQTAMVDGKLALGVNLLVAYMPWYGYNFADAVVVSDRLVKEQILTTRHEIQLAYDIPLTERVVAQTEVPPHLDATGVIKVGTEVRPGVTLLRTARLGALRHHLTSKEKETLIRQGKLYVEGSLAYEITLKDYSAQIDDVGRVARVQLVTNALMRTRRVLIWLERQCPLTIGDKLMGRHGNKGVVGKIVPAEAMPTLPNGTAVDLVLNPHGVISRMNLGQLYETHLGWVLKHRDQLSEAERQHVPAILAPFETLSREELSQWLQQTGLDAYGKTRLRDGAGGREFANPVVVGYQYIVKLDHQPEHKLAMRSTGPYALLTRQPVKGRKYFGGQRVGEMETWALQAHQASNLLEEFFTTKADEPVRRRRFSQQLFTTKTTIADPDALIRLPESLRAALLLLRGIGVVVEPPQLRNENARSKQPLDEALVHGLAWRYLTAEDLTEAKNAEVMKAGTFEKKRYAILHCGCEGFVEEISEQIEGGKLLVCKQHGLSYSGNLIRSVERWRPIPGGLYDPAIFGEVPHALQRARKHHGKTAEQEETAWRERFGYIRLAVPITNPLTNQAMTLLPVLPPIFRYRYATNTPGRNRLDRPSRKSLDGHYARILYSNDEVRKYLTEETAGNETTSERLASLQRNLEEAIQRLFRGDPNRPDVDCLERLIKGKQGIFRRAVLGKRNDYSGRAVIVPDPTLRLDECRLPYRLGVELLRPWLGNALRTHWPQVKSLLEARPLGTITQRPRALGREATIETILSHPEEPGYHQAISSVLPQVLEMNGTRLMCLLNRAPSLHKFNVLAFAIKDLWDEAVIAIPPLVCAGFNADFDGDTMGVHLPVTPKGQAEARERLTPQKNLLSPANGKLVLSLTEDIIAGLAYTADPDKRQPEGGFSRSVRQRVENAADTADAAFSYMQEGFESATRAGLSFGLFDIPVIESRRLFLDNVLASRSRSPHDFYTGALTKEEQQSIADEWGKEVREAMTARLRQALASAAPNTVALLSLTGARGDAQTVTQLGGMRGLMRRGSDDSLDYPIESNFIEGLSPVEFFFSAHGSRASLADKKLLVASAGDFTRRLVHCAYNLCITHTDCGSLASPRSVLSCLCRDGLCAQCYGEEEDTHQLPPIGRPVGLLAATAIGERGAQLSLRTFHTGGVKGDSIIQGLPHVNALLENRWVEISKTRWQMYATSLKTAEGGPNEDTLDADASHVRFRLGDVARTPDHALDILLQEAYRNYSPTDLPERLFAVILRAMWRDGKLRGLTEAARENLRPLERVAFRDAIRMATENVKQNKEQQKLDGMVERVISAAPAAIE